MDRVSNKIISKNQKNKCSKGKIVSSDEPVGGGYHICGKKYTAEHKDYVKEFFDVGNMKSLQKMNP